MRTPKQSPDVARFRADAARLTGLSLIDLGYLPARADLDELAIRRHGFTDADLRALDQISELERARSKAEAEALGGALWHASVVLVDELFEDVILFHEKIGTALDIEDTTVLGDLPPAFAHRYDGLFARRFLLVASSVATDLIRGWRSPGCVAAELATHLLLSRVETSRDLYELPLSPGWRARLETLLLADVDYLLLYEADVAQPGVGAAIGAVNLDDVDDWFAPFTPEQGENAYAQGD